MNHEKTVVNIKAIESLLNEIKAIQNRANEEIKKWSAEIPLKNYHPDHVAAKITDIKLEAETRIVPLCDRIYERINDINAAEYELTGATIDLTDTAFTNAVQLVRALGKDMPFEQQQRIAEQFKGNYPAEAILSDLYEKNGLTHVIKHTDFNQHCFKLRTYTNVFSSQREKTAAAYRNIEIVLNEMLESIQSNYRVDLGVSADAFLDALYAATGAAITK